MNTATSIRHEQADRAIAYETLRRFPEHQAEAIAKHYVAHAMVALQILKIIEVQRGALDTNPNIDQVIQLLVNQIKANHRHDLGIALEWPNHDPLQT
jgi:hypothetical protein